MYSSGDTVVITSVRGDTSTTGYGKMHFEDIREDDGVVVYEQNRSYSMPDYFYEYARGLGVSDSREREIIGDRTIYMNRAFSFRDGIHSISAPLYEKSWSVSILAIRVG